MNPIPFKGSNVIYGENQSEYLPLPALRIEGNVYSCWELSDEEINDIIKNKCIYIKQSILYNKDENGKEDFGNLQPLRPIANLEDGIILLP